MELCTKLVGGKGRQGECMSVNEVFRVASVLFHVWCSPVTSGYALIFSLDSCCPGFIELSCRGDKHPVL